LSPPISCPPLKYGIILLRIPDGLLKDGMIDSEEMKFFIVTDSIEESFLYITAQISKVSSVEKGATL